FGDELRIELGLLDLLNVDEDLAARPFLDFLLQLVDLGPLAADDDAGARRVDIDLQPVHGALGLDLRHAGVREPLLEHLAQRQIFVQQLRVIAIRVPARPPRLVESQAKSERVNLLPHDLSFASVRQTSTFEATPSPSPADAWRSTIEYWAWRLAAAASARPRRLQPPPPARPVRRARQRAPSDARFASARGTRGPSAPAARVWPTAPGSRSAPTRTGDRRRR